MKTKKYKITSYGWAYIALAAVYFMAIGIIVSCTPTKKTLKQTITAQSEQIETLDRNLSNH
ncbi:MAG: hypothetical protein FWD66_10350 [Paludibacter sp.]|nr:hypothetical protein [Paludibacter sp.]